MIKKADKLKETKLLDLSGRRNTEIAITELKAAKKCRENRESQFDRSSLRTIEVKEYVKSITEEIQLRAKAIPYQAFEIGKLLYDVKGILPHGGFEKWVSNNLPFSQSTAQNYMRIYDNCMGHPEVLRCFKLSILIEICSPRFPADLRTELFNNVEEVYEINREELLTLAFRFKRGVVDNDSEEVQNFLKIEKEKSEFNKYKSKLTTLKNFLGKQLTEFEELNKKVTSYPILKKEDNAINKKYDAIESMILNFITETDKMIKRLEREE